MYMGPGLEWKTIFALRRELFWWLFPKLQSGKEMNSCISLEWTYKQCVTTMLALFCFLHDTMNPYIVIKKAIFTHGLHASLALFMSCRWHHHRLDKTFHDATIVMGACGKRCLTYSVSVHWWSYSWLAVKKYVSWWYNYVCFVCDYPFYGMWYITYIWSAV